MTEPPRPYPQPQDPIPSCDWGECDEPGVAWAWGPGDEFWLPVCHSHFKAAIRAGVWTIADEVHHWAEADLAAIAAALGRVDR